VIKNSKSTASKPSKVAKQKPVNMLVTSSGAATSAPPPLAGVGLTTCSYNDIRHSAQRVLRYLESMKDAEANREGNGSSFHCYIFLVLLLILFFLLI
jgi:hypothetical protein